MGLLNRMLFGNDKVREERVRYNQFVERTIRTRFGIDLDHITDAYFHKNNMYQDLFKMFNWGCNTNEATAATVGVYLDGMLRKSGMNENSNIIARKLVMFIEECVELNSFDEKRAQNYLSIMERQASQYASQSD